MSNFYTTISLIKKISQTIKNNIKTFRTETMFIQKKIATKRKYTQIKTENMDNILILIQLNLCKLNFK